MNKGGFVRKKVDTLMLGERLIKMRNDRHVSIADVSRNTGIQIAYLEYLEMGIFEKLPAEVYVRGFLRRYAEYLGVSEESILRQYDRERGMNRSLNQNKKKEQSSFARGAFQRIPSAIVTPRRIVVTFFVCAALAGFSYVYNEYRLFVAEPVLVVMEPLEEVMKINQSFLAVAGKTDPDSRIYINDQAILVDENGSFREQIGLQDGVNTLVVRSVNRFGKEAKKVYSIDAELEEQKSTENDTEKSMEKKITLRTGKETMWILVVVDGRQEISMVAPSESRWEFSPKKEMVISAGNGNNVYVTIDGGKETVLSKNSGLSEGYVLDKEKEVFIVKK